MKNIKSFERYFDCDTSYREIKNGDYVKIYPRIDGYYAEDFNEFIKDHIGIVTKINKEETSDFWIIMVDFLPNSESDITYKNYSSMPFEEYELSISASSKEELELLLLSNKFNL